MLTRATPEVAEPLAEAEVDSRFGCFGRGAPVLLAVSGGPDSTALMGLAAEWSRRQGAPAPLVAAVDHGLRPGSDAEVDAVVRRAGEAGLSATILRWDGEKPSSRVQERARQARYRLLADHSRERGAGAIVTAHTLDDQAETVLMRLARGSGPAGLAGMRGESLTMGVRHLRPLLDIPKARLVATCGARGWPWIGDPSNRDTRFERTRWRQILPLLGAEGLTPERIALFARRIAAMDAAVETQAARALAEAGGAGTTRLEFARLTDAGEAVALRALARWLEAATGADTSDWKPPRLARLETLFGRLAAARAGRQRLTASLAGLVLSLDGQGGLSYRPERRRRGIVNPVALPLLGKGASGT